MEQLTLTETTVADVDDQPEQEGTSPRPGLKTSEADLSLFKAFLDLREHFRGALIALSDRLMVTNHAASEVLLPGDRPRLWALAQEALDNGRPRTGIISLSDGTSVVARYRPILTSGAPVGALVQFSVAARSLRNRRTDQIPGWSELTDAEQALAELVARGFTNREAGKRVFVSRYTVDAHLRNIFRKLGISSRAELAYLVGEHYVQLCSLPDVAGPSPQPRQPAGHQVARSA
jgi:DNA-binding CsgD family transcriptional regulator